MGLLERVVDGTQRRLGLGRCRHFFWLFVVFDTVGVVMLFTGAFADVLFYDLLLCLGSIIILISCLWWVFWYRGNMEMPPEEHLIFGRPFHMHSSTVVEALCQSVSHRFSLILSNVSSTFLRIRNRQRWRAIPRSLSLSMTISGQLEKQPENEDEDTDITESLKESSDAQDFSRRNLGSKPEDVGSSKVVCSPGSDAALPWFLKRIPSVLVLPVVTESLLDQPPTTLASPKEFIAPAILGSKSQPAISLASTAQPAVHEALTSQPSVPRASKSQPEVTLASTTQPLVVFASNSQPVVPSTLV